ncbi:MAG TPA: SIMPL domain-containing protein [Polyangiaceae bacterium]|jgi:uncharacterized protein YggE|nr:SIMPL domain-containing protein [Polyangiaceae bacterium]
MKARLTFFSAALIASALLAGCTHSGPTGNTPIVVTPDSTGVVVQGHGEIEASPDVAVFSIGVESNSRTVADARENAAKSAERIVASLAKNGVDKSDIQTGSLQVSPRYEYTQDRGAILLGYTVTNMLTVKVRNLANISRVVDDAIVAGGDDARMQGIHFTIDDPTKVRDKAREKAMAEARAKAEQLAKLAGVELGAPLSVEETSFSMPPVPMPGMMAEAKAMPQTPIEPGMSKISIDVRVRWSIDSA